MFSREPSTNRCVGLSSFLTFLYKNYALILIFQYKNNPKINPENIIRIGVIINA